MGKAKKEHRKRVAKRNEKIAQTRRSYEKKMDALRKAITEGMLQQNKVTELTEEQAEAEVISETQTIEANEITETPDEQPETKSE